MQGIVSLQELGAIRRYIYLFAFTIFIQTVHMVEHVAQVVQAFVLLTPAHGLIGQLDLEQVHFAFNILYFGAVIYVLMQWMNFGGSLCKNNKRMLMMLLAATVVIQGYHSIEHTVKLLQFISTGVQGTPGIAGMFFNGVWFHFFMNLIVYTPPVVVFFCAGLHKRLFDRSLTGLRTSESQLK